MKKLLRSLARNESGQGVLITVLVLLILGALLIVPLLNLMGTGLQAGRVHEVRTEEYYAADAGVEEAIYWLPQLAENNGTAGPYAAWVRTSPLDINGKTVNVTIEPVGIYFKIDSTATSVDGRETIIIAYTGGLLSNAITSNGDVDLRPGEPKVNVTGDIMLNGELDPSNYQPNDGEVFHKLTMNWPDADDINTTCWNETHVPGSESLPASIDIQDKEIIGPAYRDGDLEIDNNGDSGATLTLNKSVYVSGNLNFKQPGAQKNYTINLNNQTIYADGEIDFPAERCSLVGPGCIIARGTVNFQPAIVGEEFILVMSTENDVWFKPQGAFYGSVAGNVTVDLQAGSTLTWTEPPPDLWLVDLLRTACLRILSWEISLG
jgi:hypothetical protein